MPNSAVFDRLIPLLLLPPCCLAAGQTQKPPSSFEVQISLSQKAEAKLNSASQGIVLVAAYSAAATPAAQTQGGKLDLGRQTMDAPGRSETVRMNGPTIPDRILAEIQGPVLLNLTAHSGNIHSTQPSDLLTCTTFDGNLQAAVDTPPVVHCGLPGENNASDSGAPQAIPPERVADSYAIYSMLVPGSPHNTIARTPAHNWGIADTTVNISDMNPAVPPNGALKPPSDNSRAFDEAVQDYESHRYQRFHLDAASFQPGAPLPLLSEQQVRDIRRSRSANNGIAFFSAVYFNDKQTAALVYVNIWCATLCAAGQWVYLEKHGNEWVRRSGITSP